MKPTRDLKVEFLMHLNFPPADPSKQEPQIFGETPFGYKFIGRSAGGGTFEGPKIKGTVIEAADWFTLNNEIGTVDARDTLKTDDGEMIYMTYPGFLHGRPGGKEDFMNRFLAGQVEYEEYYFRTSPVFVTGSEKYDWLNGLVTIGVGEAIAGGVAYDIYIVR